MSGDALKQERDEPEAEKAEGDAEKSRPCCGTLGKRAGHLGGHPASLSDGGRWRQRKQKCLLALQYACARARHELWLARGPTERTATKTISSG